MVIKAPLANLRRLTGANFLMVEHGAAADVALDDLDKNAKTELWQKSTRELLDAVGWTDSKIAVRSFDGGVTLQVSAPTDALHSGMSLVEAAWDYTNSILAKIPFDLNGVVKDLKKQICDEHSPLEVSLAVRAKGLGLTYLGHDDKISIGLGVGGAVYDVTNLPSADDVEWGKLHDIPIAMVTGTNGKSTTVRLAAAIGQAAGHCVGLSSSDWVRVGGEILDEGDYSGPAGARLAVRDPRVDLGIIETARGGLMRRGLPVPTADVCLLTNIAADHLGTYGIMDVCALADAKFQISQAVKPNGWLVLNADDPELVKRGSDFSGQLSWFGLDFNAVNLQELIAKGGRAAFLQNDFMMLAKDGEVSQVMHVNDFVPALKGAAKFNVYNALGAIALTDALGLSTEAMAKGLAGFTDTPDQNPGRGNYFEVGGVQMLIDFAHNPHGVLALADAVKSIPANRRLAIAGQAGDRSNQDTCDMMQAMWTFDLDMVVVAELPHMLRGRQLGEMTQVIKDELLRLGAEDQNILTTDTEFSAVKKALEWAEPGDFLALLVHEDLKQTLALLDELKRIGWKAGEPLPSTD